jgi:hypothetical protein
MVTGVVSLNFMPDMATEHYRIESYQPSGDRLLTVEYTYGACDRFRKAVLVEETDEQVVVAATYVSDLLPDACIAIGYFGTATFQLREPLRDRPVYYDDGERYVRAPFKGLLWPASAGS